jgi:hypothetical protein
MANPQQKTADPLARISGGIRKETPGGNPCKDNTPKLTPQARWAKAHPLKRWAHVAVASALRHGLLTRPDRCDDCGKVGPVDAHHDPERYDEPLHIEAWVCRSCHKARHKQPGQGTQ